MLWMIFMKISKNTIQIKNAKYCYKLLINIPNNQLIQNIKICLVIKKFKSIGTELFIRGRKVNVSPVFIAHSYFAVPKNIRLNFTHYFIMKILNKQQLQQIAFNHSSYIDFRGFMIFTKYLLQNYFTFSN